MLKVKAYMLDDELSLGQKRDLDILMSLRTKEQKRSWIDSVDSGDYYYGISLLLVAHIKEIEFIADTGDLAEAKEVLKKFTIGGK